MSGVSVNVNFPDASTGRSTHDATITVEKAGYDSAWLRLNRGDFLRVEVFLHGEDIARLVAALTGANGEDVCGCGHFRDQHQTGVGAWTGFCEGVLRDLGPEYWYEGANLDEPCVCDGFVAEEG